MSMTIERVRALITDRLSGELGEREAEELESYLAEHPEFSEEMEHLEAVWHALGLLDKAEGPDLRALDILVGRLFDLTVTRGRLSDEELEMLSAAGRDDPSELL